MDESRTGLVNQIRGWFLKNSDSWFSVSILSLLVILLFWTLIEFFGNYFGPLISALISIAVVPVSGLFFVGVFWRGSLQVLLSLCGGLSTDFGFYVYSKYLELQYSPPIITNRLGVGRLANTSIDSIATFYILMGIFSLVFVLLLTFRPAMFRARGSKTQPAYPIWSQRHELNKGMAGEIILVPVQSLLNYTEKHLSLNYRYLVVLIGGEKFFVTPDGWVPQGSFIVRDRLTRSMLGVPKVPDGFNIW